MTSQFTDKIRSSVPHRAHSNVAKTISAWTAFLFGIHCISLSSSGIIPFSFVASVWPGASISGVLSIAVIFCLVHAVAFAIIGQAVPMEGADYVFASRVLSPRLAFPASWTLVLASGIVAGGLAAWVPATAIPSLLRPMAIIFNDPSYAQLADYASAPVGVIVVGSIIVLIAFLTTFREEGALRVLLNVGFFLASPHGSSFYGVFGLVTE